MNNSTDKKARRIAMLLAGYVRDTLTPAEHDELDEWVGASDKNMLLFEEFTDENRIQLALDILNGNDKAGILKKLREDPNYVYVPSPRYRRLKRFAIAASLVIIGGSIVYFLTKNSSTHGTGPLASDKPSVQQEILPASNKAKLTLDNDSVITLEARADGMIAREGSSNIIIQNNELKYERSADGTQNTLLENTLTTSRGEKYSLTLSDGTKIWLNAASSIRYPPVFIGNERRVLVTGEVYFEVASAKLPGPNYQKPFIVDVKEKNMRVDVMGTHFNINAYSDEPMIKTTLVEGAIKIASASTVKKLEPRQQAQVMENGEIKILDNVETLFETGWKDGAFVFSSSNPEAAMKLLSRWYNVDIQYPDGIPKFKEATLNLNSPLDSLLAGLDSTESHFIIEGRKVIVTP